MLLPEEQLVLGWLTEYGTLRRKQLEALLSRGMQRSAVRFISGMIERALVFSPVRSGYISLDNSTEHDANTIDALWVLLMFEVLPQNHYKAAYPSQVYFVKGNSSYEICVIHTGEEHLAKLLRPKPEHKYILVIDREEQMEKLVLPEVPCLFAVLSNREEDAPAIKFIHKEKE